MNKFLLSLFLLIPITVFANLPPTTSKIDGDATKKTTFDFEFPNFTGTHTGTKVSITGANNLPVSGDISLTNTKYATTLVGKSLAELNSTGLLSGAVTAINANPTLFNFGAGTGEVIDYATDPTSPTIKPVSWSSFTGVTVTNIASADKTYVSVDSTGALFQQTTFPTQAERRLRIFAAVVVHPNRTTIQNITTLPDFTQGIGSQVYDFLDALGAFNIVGNKISANGANLSLDKTAGSVFRRSTNYATDDQNPHVTNSAAATPKAFIKSTVNAQVGGSVTVIDPANYDVAGTVTAVPGGANAATVQRVYLFSSGLMFVQYGQVAYGNLADAVAGISQENFTVNPSIADGGILLAYVAVTKTCTALNSSTCAKILPAARFDAGAGGGSTAVTTMQGAYNNSTAPQVITDSTRGAVDIQRGSAADTDSVFRIQNGAGVAKVDVKGDGEIKVENKITADNLPRDRNLLPNPSFEYATVGTGWTLTGGGSLSASGAPVDGAVKAVWTSTGAWSLANSSTTNAAQLGGNLCSYGIWYASASTDANTWLCPFNNSTTITPNASQCANYTKFGAYQYLSVVDYCGSTSSGIKLSGAIAATHAVDDAMTGSFKTPPASFSNNTSPAPCTFSTLTWQGFTTVTHTLLCKRDGDELVVSGSVTPSASNGSVVLIPLPNNYGTINLKTNGTYPVGRYYRGTAAVSHGGAINAQTGTDTTFLRMGSSQTYGSASVAPMDAAVGTSTVTAGETFAVEARISIAEWQANTNASIAGCVSATGCTEGYQALISSTGVKSQENVPGWLSGNCVVSATAQYDCPVASGVASLVMNCDAKPVLTAFTTVTGAYDVANSTNVNARSRIFNSATGSAFANGFTLTCNKQGADFKPKTVVVSPLQGYVKVPGAENLNVESFSFSYGATVTSACTTGTCAYLDQIGNIVNSVQWTAVGNYTVNLLKTYSKLKCSGNVFGSSYQMRCENCSSFPMVTVNFFGGSNINAYGTVMCQGTY